MLKGRAEMLSNSILEKLAAKMGQTQAEKERDMIRKIQNPSDPLAEKLAISQLLAEYRGTINNVIVQTGLHKLVGYDVAVQMAQQEIVHIVKNKFDLKSQMAKPNTYIREALTGAMMNAAKDNSNQGIQKSQANRGHERLVETAKQYLRREKDTEPTNKEIYNFVKTHMSKGGKDFTLGAVQRINDEYNIKELSGGRIYGNRNQSGSEAEQLLYEDVIGAGQRQSPEELLKRQYLEEGYSREIDVFTSNVAERRFLKQIYGIGIYKGQKISKNRAALNNGITNFKGDKLLRGFREHLKQKGMI